MRSRRLGPRLHASARGVDRRPAPEAERRARAADGEVGPGAAQAHGPRDPDARKPGSRQAVLPGFVSIRCSEPPPGCGRRFEFIALVEAPRPRSRVHSRLRRVLACGEDRGPPWTASSGATPSVPVDVTARCSPLDSVHSGSQGRQRIELRPPPRIDVSALRTRFPALAVALPQSVAGRRRAAPASAGAP
jgi:hypothetical protein